MYPNDEEGLPNVDDVLWEEWSGPLYDLLKVKMTPEDVMAWGKSRGRTIGGFRSLAVARNCIAYLSLKGRAVYKDGVWWRADESSSEHD